MPMRTTTTYPALGPIIKFYIKNDQLLNPLNNILKNNFLFPL